MAERSNTNVTILPSIARDVVSASTDFVNPGYRGAIFTIDYALPTSAPTVGPTFVIEARAYNTPGLARYHTIASIGSSNSTSTGFRRVIIYPGASTANLSTAGIVEQEIVSIPLPPVYRIRSLSASTGTCEYGVAVSLVN